MKSAVFGQFMGFDAGSQKMILVPEQFFNDLLPSIDTLDELKLALAVIHLSVEKWGRSPAFTLASLEQETLIRLIRANPASSESLDQTLGRLVRRGFVIEVTRPGEKEMRFALNSARGRKLAGSEAGESPIRSQDLDQNYESHHATNIFSLYEDAVGTISPLLVEDLRQAEKLYPLDWIKEAFVQAVKYNRRSWRYVESILERWAHDGR